MKEVPALETSSTRKRQQQQQHHQSIRASRSDATLHAAGALLFFIDAGSAAWRRAYIYALQHIVLNITVYHKNPFNLPSFFLLYLQQ